MKNYQLIIQDISRLIDQAEVEHDAAKLIQARRKLNNELPQAVDEYVEQERQNAAQGAVVTSVVQAKNEFCASLAEA
jgi:hypothetical protein